MRCIFIMVGLIFWIATVSLAGPKEKSKPSYVKHSASHVVNTNSSNVQATTLKQQVHLYTVWVRRTLDDCKRDDVNDHYFNAESSAMSQDNQAYHLKVMEAITAKKTEIGKDVAADLTLALAAYKVMHGNPLFSRLYLETERCFDDNFVPQGFKAEQLAKLRFVELK